MRESDGIHFLWNGEHPIRVSPFKTEPVELPNAPQYRWHCDYGQIPDTEKALLDSVMSFKRQIVFNLINYGRYRVVARGEFKEP
jgi:hypothetical protein